MNDVFFTINEVARFFKVKHHTIYMCVKLTKFSTYRVWKEYRYHDKSSSSGCIKTR
ncbi:MAG: hypothetical protein ABDH23_06605 [Endomicrobiia bacterium]